MKKRTILSVILVLSFLLPTAALALNFETLVVFGDSLSDNGNLFAVDSSQVPSAIYYEGRFSNGPVWVEYLAGEGFLDCSLVDNAYGGATTDGESPPGLISQVSAYTSSAPIDDNTLFVIWIGANDFLNGSVDYEASAINIRMALDDLADFGAKHVLIANLPDMGSSPRFLGMPDENSARFLSFYFNMALANVIDAYARNHPGVAVYEFDSYSFLHNVANDPGSYGFSNATQVCPSYSIANDFDNSMGYVFWDTIHPTTEAHELLAERVLEILEQSGDDDDNSCFINSLLPISQKTSARPSAR